MKNNEPKCEFSPVLIKKGFAVGRILEPNALPDLMNAEAVDIFNAPPPHAEINLGGFEQMKSGLDVIATLLLAHDSAIQDLKREVELLKTKAASQAFTDLAASAAAALRAKEK